MLRVFGFSALILILIAWIGWIAWMVLFHVVIFGKYSKLFDSSVDAFDAVSQKIGAALAQNDLDTCEHLLVIQQSLLDRQDHYLRALRAVSACKNAPPWRWRERWKADYLEETRAA